MKKTILFFVILILLVFTSLWILNNQDSSVYQSISKKNSCISCHQDMQGFSSSHSLNKVTCNDCHLGNHAALTKKEAHKNMVLIPGNLSNTSKTCANCHKGIDHRVQNSLMNTMSGIISVDKFVFNENSNLDSLFNIHHLKNKSLADSHLRNKCASCHIGNEKLKASPITEKSRGGGCTACHLNYSDKAKQAHKNYINSNKKEALNIHPSLSLQITDNHCFGCHSRSGRISTNYEGWHETIYKDTLFNNPNYRVLEDKRVFIKQAADIHHTKGLSCVDCHDSYDVMGNGIKYAHQEDAVNIRCNDCHIPFNKDITTFDSIPFQKLKADEKRIIELRKIDTTRYFIYSKISKKNLINVIKDKNDLILLTKNTSKKLKLSSQGKNCSNPVHNNLQCSACHTAWTPQCISCHTSYDKNEDGYDLLKKEWKIGTWQEKGSKYLAEYPTLGVVNKNNSKTIKTFSPGMIMHLKKDSLSSFHRLFAPVSAHTISKKGKNCKECHNNPVAIGYGRGVLKYRNKKWHFTPKYTKEKDGLPLDSWIGFLSNDTLNKTTRNNARPFNLNEQQRILKVGSCLTCHGENTKVVHQILINYSKALANRKTACFQ